MAEKFVYKADARRYEAWIERVRTVMRLLEALNDAQPDAMRGIRAAIEQAAANMDDLILPNGWRSWEELGDAIHGRKWRPRTW